MKFAKLFPPSVQDDRDETCTIGTTFNLKEVIFSPIPTLAPATALRVDGGSALLFGTPSRAVAIIKICQITTQGMQRTATITRTYLVSITSDTEQFLIRAQALSNPDSAMTACLQQEIPKSAVPPDTTPEMLLDTVRTLAEHSIRDAIHDGGTRTTNPWLQQHLQPSAAIAKTSHILTSKSRPLGMALLTYAPAGTWVAQLTKDIACVRLDNRASHVFLVEQPTPELLATLQAWSSDLAFPGYPYPLVLADQLARVTNNERDAWKIIIATDADAAKILNGELKATDAHAVLEHILYGK